jgi:tetratricopeptide (TPR) repeat protein
MNPEKEIKELQLLGNQYERSNKITDAIKCYKKIISLNTFDHKSVNTFDHKSLNNGVILNQIGVCYTNLSDFNKAIDYFKKVLTIKNDIPDVYNNLGVCYNNLKNYKQAETCFLISLRLLDNDKINSMLGSLYFYIKHYDNSIFFYRKMKPTHIDLYNMSFPYLAKQEFSIGLKLYENRLLNNGVCSQTKQNLRADVPFIPYWNGSDKCNHLLIIYEQGIGDNIQYFRFMIELSVKYPTMKITYFCKAIISHLFKDYKNINVVTQLSLNVFEYKIYIMSLPYFLNISTISANTEEYIKVDNTNILHWQGILHSDKKARLKVGFTYNGLLSSFIDKYIPLKEFEKLCDLNIDLICIHKMEETETERKNLSDTITNKIKFFNIDDINKTLGFSDTISLLKSIDLLITIDTAIVHLAGVLGIKTWLLLGYGSDWRWMKEEKTTCWYTSVELVRMTENKELYTILDKVKEKLLLELLLR